VILYITFKFLEEFVHGRWRTACGIRSFSRYIDRSLSVARS